MVDDYPFQSNFLDVRGLRYHYLDEGSGDPVVMLHGNPTWSYYYRHLILALRGSHRAIVPDHIGCGLSEKPDDQRYDYTLERRVEDLEMLLETLEVRSGITLVLHDWGGMIGMAFAARHPDRIARIVVLNTGAFPLPDSKPFPWALWLCRETKLGGYLVRRFNAFSLAASLVGCKRRSLTRAERAMYTSPYDSWDNRIATLRFVEDIPLSEGDKSYALVSSAEKSLHRFRSIPMMICWGLEDFVFDEHFLAEWMRRFPDAEVHRFEDSGHYVMEDAREEIISLTKRFLERHPLSSVGEAAAR